MVEDSIDTCIEYLKKVPKEPFANLYSACLHRYLSVGLEEHDLRSELWLLAAKVRSSFSTGLGSSFCSYFSKAVERDLHSQLRSDGWDPSSNHQKSKFHGRQSVLNPTIHRRVESSAMFSHTYFASSVGYRLRTAYDTSSFSPDEIAKKLGITHRQSRNLLSNEGLTYHLLAIPASETWSNIDGEVLESGDFTKESPLIPFDNLSILPGLSVDANRLDNLTSSLLVHGQIMPVLIQASTGYVVDGIHRFQALQQLGATGIFVFTIPAISRMSVEELIKFRSSIQGASPQSQESRLCNTLRHYLRIGSLSQINASELSRLPIAQQDFLVEKTTAFHVPGMLLITLPSPDISKLVNLTLLAAPDGTTGSLPGKRLKKFLLQSLDNLQDTLVHYASGMDLRISAKTIKQQGPSVCIVDYL